MSRVRKLFRGNCVVKEFKDLVDLLNCCLKAFNISREVPQFNTKLVQAKPDFTPLFPPCVRRKARECGLDEPQTFDDLPAVVQFLDQLGAKGTLILPDLPENFKSEILAKYQLVSEKIKATLLMKDLLFEVDDVFPYTFEKAPHFENALEEIDESYSNLRRKTCREFRDSATREKVGVGCLDHALIYQDGDFPLDMSRLLLRGRKYLGFRWPHGEQVTAQTYQAFVEEKVPVLITLADTSEKDVKGDIFWPSSVGRKKIFKGKSSDGTNIKVVVRLVMERFRYVVVQNSVEFLTRRDIEIEVKNLDRDQEVQVHALIQLHLRCFEDHGIPNPLVLFHTVCIAECLTLGIPLLHLETFRCQNQQYSPSYGFHPTYYIPTTNSIDPPIWTLQLRATLAEFYKLTNGKTLSYSPIAVHCHGGVGRTGVFILAHHYAMKFLVKGSAILKKRTRLFFNLFRLRLQRDAIQGAEQLAFVCHFLRAIQNIEDSSSFLIPLSFYRKGVEKIVSCEGIVLAFIERTRALNIDSLNFKTRNEYQDFITSQGDLLEQTLFLGMNGHSVEDFSRRIAKFSAEVHKFVMKLIESRISLLQLNAILIHHFFQRYAPAQSNIYLNCTENLQRGGKKRKEKKERKEEEEKEEKEEKEKEKEKEEEEEEEEEEEKERGKDFKMRSSGFFSQETVINHFYSFEPGKHLQECPDYEPYAFFAFQLLYSGSIPLLEQCVFKARKREKIPKKWNLTPKSPYWNDRGFKIRRNDNKSSLVNVIQTVTTQQNLADIQRFAKTTSRQLLALHSPYLISICDVAAQGSMHLGIGMTSMICDARLFNASSTATLEELLPFFLDNQKKWDSFVIQILLGAASGLEYLHCHGLWHGRISLKAIVVDLTLKQGKLTHPAMHQMGTNVLMDTFFQSKVRAPLRREAWPLYHASEVLSKDGKVHNEIRHKWIIPRPRSKDDVYTTVRSIFISDPLMSDTDQLKEEFHGIQKKEEEEEEEAQEDRNCSRLVLEGSLYWSVLWKEGDHFLVKRNPTILDNLERLFDPIRYLDPPLSFKRDLCYLDISSLQQPPVPACYDKDKPNPQSLSLSYSSSPTSLKLLEVLDAPPCFLPSPPSSKCLKNRLFTPDLQSSNDTFSPSPLTPSLMPLNCRFKMIMRFYQSQDNKTLFDIAKKVPFFHKFSHPETTEVLLPTFKEDLRESHYKQPQLEFSPQSWRNFSTFNSSDLTDAWNPHRTSDELVVTLRALASSHNQSATGTNAILSFWINYISAEETAIHWATFFERLGSFSSAFYPHSLTPLMYYNAVWNVCKYSRLSSRKDWWCHLRYEMFEECVEQLGFYPSQENQDEECDSDIVLRVADFRSEPQVLGILNQGGIDLEITAEPHQQNREKYEILLFVGQKQKDVIRLSQGNCYLASKPEKKFCKVILLIQDLFPDQFL